jgi:hypothetical protein
MIRRSLQPRDAEGHFIITGPTVLSAFFFAGVAGALALAIVIALGAIMSAMHRAQMTSCSFEITSSPAEQIATTQQGSAAFGGCAAGEPILRGAK